MPLKKHSPGCKCCARGLSFEERAHGNLDAPSRIVLASAPPPPFTTTSSGVPGVPFSTTNYVGHDVDRAQAILQRLSDGQCYTLDSASHAVALLWPSTSDIASLADLNFVRYHHAWGVAVFYSGAYDDGLGAAGVMGVVDGATGNFIYGPVTTVGSGVFEQSNANTGLGGSSVNGAGSCYLSTDPEGNLYDVAGDALQLTTGIIRKNGVEYCRANSPTNSSTSQMGNAIFHDGVDLYFFGYFPGTSVADRHVLWRAVAGNDGVGVVKMTDLFDSDHAFLHHEPVRMSAWDASSSLIQMATFDGSSVRLQWHFFNFDLSRRHVYLTNYLGNNRHLIIKI